jgi:double-strand break repair protein MRE11
MLPIHDKLFQADRPNIISEADTIRILVATDNHVGYEERDAIRKDDSWRTFDEILNLARTEDVRLSIRVAWHPRSPHELTVL